MHGSAAVSLRSIGTPVLSASEEERLFSLLVERAERPTAADHAWAEPTALYPGRMGDNIDGRSLRYQHRRGELLEAVGEYVLDNGLASLSLRRVAEAVGVSHVTLQHHFGTKEQLVGEIVEHLLERTLIPKGVYPTGSPIPTGTSPTRWRALWAQLTSPPGLRDIACSSRCSGRARSRGRVRGGGRALDRPFAST